LLNIEQLLNSLKVVKYSNRSTPLRDRTDRRGVIAVTMVINRRERIRAATVQEIKDVARQQLVALGPSAVSLRAIGREMGMTAPALYRYFPSFDHLLRALVTDMYHEACGVMVTARDSIHETAPDSAPARCLIAATQAFRAWAVAHRAEFGLIFGNPLPSVPTSITEGPMPSTAPKRSATPFTAIGGPKIIIGLFEQMWQQQPYATPAPDAVSSTLLEQVATYRETIHTALPTGALYTAMSAWLQILGMVSLEVFGHVPFAPHDGAAFFSQQLREILASLGVTEQLVPLSH